VQVLARSSSEADCPGCEAQWTAGGAAEAVEVAPRRMGLGSKAQWIAGSAAAAPRPSLRLTEGKSD